MDKAKMFLLARSVEHQMKLDDYTDEQLKLILSIMDKSQRDLSKVLSSATITDWSKDRTNALLEEVQDLSLGVKQSISGHISDVTAIAGAESYTAHSAALSFDGAAKNVNSVAMTSETLKAIIVKTPIGGNTLEKWVDKSLSSNLKDKVQKEVAAGLINGSSYADITKRLKSGWTGAKHELETLTKTYVASVNSQAMQDVFNANKDVIKGVEWRAAFSNRTCLRCAGLDGQEYYVNNHPPIPLHPRCRCVLIPVTANIKTMGLSQKDVDKAARSYTIKEGKIVGLGGKGKTIDAGTWKGDYDSWIKQLTPSQQKDFLGPKRLELINSGKIKFNDLVDKKSGRLRMIEELPGYKQKVADATAKAMATKASKAAVTKVEKETKAVLDKSMQTSSASTAAGIKKAASEAAVKRAAQEAIVAKAAEEKAAKLAKEAAAREAARQAKIESDKLAKAAVQEAAAKLAAKQAAEAAAKIAKEVAEKAATKLAEKQAHEAAVKAYNEKWKISEAKEQFINSMLAGESASQEATMIWIENATKEEVSYLNAKLAKIEAKKAAEEAAAAKATPDIASLKAKNDAALSSWEDAGEKFEEGIINKAKLLEYQKAYHDANKALKEATSSSIPTPEKTVFKSENFTKMGNANINGVHQKEFWHDKNGEKFLFKPLSDSDHFIAHGEEAAYKIGRLINPDVVEVRAITLDGKIGSIQKWRTDLKSDIDFSNISPKSLTIDEKSQLAKEHVLDWLISNHDGHSEQFIRAKDGKVFGIDKGQAFKHLGKDKLSTDYAPNAGYGFKGPYYNDLFKAVKAGDIDIDPSHAFEAIKKIEAITDDEYKKILTSYAEGRFKYNGVGPLNHFYNNALARKHSIRADMEGFYADILNKPGFKFGKVDVKAAKVETKAAAKVKAANAKALDDHNDKWSAIKSKAKEDYANGMITWTQYDDTLTVADKALSSPPIPVVPKVVAPKLPKAAKLAPGEKSSPAKPGKVGARFKNEEHIELYYQEKERYAKFFDTDGMRDAGGGATEVNAKAARDLIQNEFNDVWRIMSSWQGSTNQRGPMDLRAMHLIMEHGNTQTAPFVPSRYSQEFNGPQLMRDCREHISEKSYIRLRAFNQAYMEKKGVKSLTLKRGTDGDEGRDAANDLIRAKPQVFKYEDRELSGYTTSQTTASKFGTNDGGYEVKIKFSPDEILLHTDLFQGLTGSYQYEKEYICLSKTRKIDSKNLRISGKNFGEDFWRN